MTNADLFAYMYGCVMKQGTAHAWNAVHKAMNEDRVCQNWLSANYTALALPGMGFDDLVKLHCQGFYKNAESDESEPQK